MNRILVFFVVAVSFALFYRSRWILSIKQARRKTMKGKATMFDVRQLLLADKKDLAIEVYGQLFSTTRRESKKAVEELEKSIQEKKPELE